ncbi:hypothetical protein NWF32_21845 [Pseudomonas qingdaonensis]|nr:hypothetical protein [Pseudomonas qingdaonensis]
MFVLDQSAFPSALSVGARRVWDQALRTLEKAGWTLQSWVPEDELNIGRLSECNSMIIAYEGIASSATLHMTLRSRSGRWCAIASWPARPSAVTTTNTPLHSVPTPPRPSDERSAHPVLC